jgi:energy-coupling factor transporter ATP-binding protein EcfA2
MIRRVSIRRFKRFEEVVFELPGHVVLAGPNNTGKTTLLQAIAAWGLALNHWRQRNDFQRHGTAYSFAPIARQAFSAVPLRAFDLLWSDRKYKKPIEIQLDGQSGWSVTMELHPDSTEQIKIRPRNDADSKVLRELQLQTVFVPAMTGLGVEEHMLKRPAVDYYLGQAKPGEVLRNLLVDAHESATAWPPIVASIERHFGYQLLPPDARGAFIVAEYLTGTSGHAYDIACGGSGFQQVLMLLAFLHTRREAVLLIDEPDSHLHVMLQDAIYSELRRVAATTNSQMIVATHSEVLISSTTTEFLDGLQDLQRNVQAH